MLEVPARHRPQPVGREERVLVEEPLEDPQQVLDVDDAEQEPAVAGLADHMALGRVVIEPEVAVLDQARESLADRLRAPQDRLVDHRERGQRQDPDHRTHAHRHDGAVGMP